MRIKINESQELFDQAAAKVIADCIRKKPAATIGLATGHTPKGMYEALVQLYQDNQVDFSMVKVLNLDEYLGVDLNNPGTCMSYLTERFYKHVNLSKSNIHFFNSEADDYEEECRRYDRHIEMVGGIDLLILGIGYNGHLGFNEPGTKFDTTVHVEKLTDITRTANTWSFGEKDKVPTHGITLGMKNIMHAGKLMLMVNGKKKAGILHEAIYGEVTEALPASVVQLHNDLVLVVDADAAAEIDNIGK